MADAYKDELKNTLVDRSMKTSGPTSSFAGGSGKSPEYPEPSSTAPQQNAPVGSQYGAAPTAPTGLPAPGPESSGGIPPAWQRYSTGLQMQRAYANNWQPNPIILRMMRGR